MKIIQNKLYIEYKKYLDYVNNIINNELSSRTLNMLYDDKLIFIDDNFNIQELTLDKFLKDRERINAIIK